MRQDWKGSHRIEFEGMDEYDDDYVLVCSCGWMAGGGGLPPLEVKRFARKAFKRHQANPERCAECPS